MMRPGIRKSLRDLVAGLGRVMDWASDRMRPGSDDVVGRSGPR